MARLTTPRYFLRYLLCGILLSACASEQDVAYEAVDGLTVIEAETWTSKQDSQQHIWLKTTSEDSIQSAKLGLRGGSNSEAAISNRDPQAIYQININDIGTHYLWIRARVLNDSTTATLTVSVTPTGNAQQIAVFETQWQWISMNVNENTLSVPVTSTDPHQLRITTDSNELLLDKLILTTLPGFVPNGPGPVATLVDTANNPATEDFAADNAINNALQDEQNSAGETAQIIEPEIGNDPTVTEEVFDTQEQVARVNTQPQVKILYQGNAATDLVTTVGQELQLIADASDDGLPTASLFTYWTQVIGPSDVEFNDRTATDPIVRFDTPGNYTLQVSANDTELYKNALVSITVEARTVEASLPIPIDATVVDTSAVTTSAGETSVVETSVVDTSVVDTTAVDTPINQDNSGNTEDNAAIGNEQPPIVSINATTSEETGLIHHLTATTNSSDSPVFYYWNLVHGNGTALFENLDTQNTTVSFDQPGQYIIQVSASNDHGYNNASIEINATNPLNVANSQSTQIEPGNAESSVNLADRPLIVAAPESAPEPDTVDFSNIGSTNIGSTNISSTNIGSTHRWQNAFASGAPSKRHETSGVAVNGKIYVIGGRGHKPIDVYDSATNSWSQAARPPIEMHHFQAVAVDHMIYVVGAATCCFPIETNIADIYQFDTLSGNWSKGATIPANRRRGSTAAAVYNKKIYIVGGNTRGHSGGAVNWFDEFDPATGQWQPLADAPDARDHASIAIVGDQLVVAGGRRSDHPNTFGNTVGRTNIYDLKQQRWTTAANIPTQRAGTMAVGVGSELIVLGGESLATKDAHDAVEAFDIFSGNWRSLSPLPTARHGGAAVVLNNNVHVVAGSRQRGGAPETDVHEILK